MRSKHAVPTQRASAANKPFMTEYRLAYKDPTASQKRKIPLSKKAQQQAKSAEPKKEPVMRIVVEEKPIDTSVAPSTSLTLPAMMSGAEKANVSLAAYRQRRRNLAAEHKKGLHQKYNVITGSAIEVEPTSGFKEGRRAVIQTISHIDTIINARSPGYNIITGHDALSGKDSEEIQTIFGGAAKPHAH